MRCVFDFWSKGIVKGSFIYLRNVGLVGEQKRGGTDPVPFQRIGLMKDCQLSLVSNKVAVQHGGPGGELYVCIVNVPYTIKQ